MMHEAGLCTGTNSGTGTIRFSVELFKNCTGTKSNLGTSYNFVPVQKSTMVPVQNCVPVQFYICVTTLPVQPC